MRAEERRVGRMERLLHLRSLPILGTLGPEDLGLVAEQMHLNEIWERRQTANNETQLFAGLAGAVWLINILDILASQPEAQAPHPDSRFTLGSSPAGRPALVWSRSF